MPATKGTGGIVLTGWELATRVLVDAGVRRARAIRMVGAAGFILGLPSAISLAFLHNQDFVWGVALMLCGMFFAIAVIVNGVTKFRQEQLNHEHSDIRVGKWWDIVIGVVVPLEALLLLGWWIYQVRGDSLRAWLDPISEANVGTMLFQWLIVLIVLIAANRFLTRNSASAQA